VLAGVAHAAGPAHRHRLTPQRRGWGPGPCRSDGERSSRARATGARITGPEVARAAR
jgi:hypothetical protein